MKCMPVCLEILSAQFPPPNSSNHLGFGPQLWFFFLLNSGSLSQHLYVVLLSKPMLPSWQPALLQLSRQTSTKPPGSSLLLLWGTWSNKKKTKKRKDWWSSNVSHFSRSQFTVQALRILSCSLQTGALLHLLLLFSLPPQFLNPPSLLLLAWAEPGFPMTTGGYPVLHCCLCVGGGRASGGESCLRAVVMCSVVVSSKRNPACLLRSRITRPLFCAAASQRSSITFPETQNRLCL